MSTPEDPRVLNVLYQLTSLAGRDHDPNAALGAALDILVATFSADAGAIALLNPGSGRLETEVQVGMPPGHDPAGLKLGHGITGWCVLNSRSILVPDVSTELRYIAVRPTAKCEMAAPMTNGTVVIGVIDLESDRLGGFTPEDLSLLERLTHYFSTYKLVPGSPNKITLAGAYSREHAERVIVASQDDYTEVYGETPPTLRF